MRLIPVLAVVLAATLASAAPGPVPRNAQSCAALVKAYPGAPCSFDLTKFRFDDRVLDAVESGASARLFTGQRYTVRNAQDLAQLRGKLKPGDEVVLANGEWPDIAFSLHADGTEAHPIYIHAQSDAGAVFTGTGSAAFSGSHLVVRGLAFRRGAVVRDQFVVLRLGDGDANPCDRCVADRITIDAYNSAPEGYDTIKVLYLVLVGRDITVANSFLGNKKNTGTMISASQLPACPQDAGGCYQRLLFVKNDISGFTAAKPDPNGDHKLIQLGWSAVSTRSAYSAILDNVFEHATGENETISLKASDVVVRGNLFRANRGVLNLRSTNRVLVENNIFDGAGIDGMGGVRVEGAGHWIVHNLFKNLDHPSDYYYWPIAIHTASDEDLKDKAEDYARVKDLVIAGNRFENDLSPPIALGIYPDAAHGRVLLPKNVFLLGNSFSRPGAIFFVGGPAQYGAIVEHDAPN